MNKKKVSLILFLFLLLFISSICLISCSRNDKEKYKIEKNGLIYNKETHQLFTGRIIDTSYVIIEFDVLNGVKNGRFTTYFLNGQTEKSGLILNNKNEGIWKYFYPSGQLKTTGSFCNDKPSGQWKFYYSNGTLKISGSYLNGRKYGIWSYYSNAGELINRFYYKNGLLLKIQIRTA